MEAEANADSDRTELQSISIRTSRPRTLWACPALRPARIWGPGRKGPFRRVLGLGHTATKETMTGAVAGNSRDHEGYRPVPSKLADEEFLACVPNIFYSCFLIVNFLWNV